MAADTGDPNEEDPLAKTHAAAAADDGLGQTRASSQPGSTAPPEGAPRLDARYQVVGRLGQGGMATVWRARDAVLNREVAIKQLKPGYEAEGRARFVREAQVAASLAHENVVQVYDFYARDDGSYLAMELVEGRSLRELLEERGRLPWLLAVFIAHEVARALAFAHERGITHRDVKPENVLLTAGGGVKLSDFGIAAVVSAERLTAPQALIGTPLYLAPERIRGEEPDARADVFSLGVTLYELVAGATPWKPAALPALLHSISHDDPASIETVVPGIDRTLARLIGRCIARDPAQRPKTCGEVVAELRDVIAAHSTGDVRAALQRQLSQSGTLDRLDVPKARPRGARRWPLAALLGLAALLAGAYVVAGRAGWLQPARSEPLRLAVADFENQTGDPELDALSGLLVTSLEQSRQLNVLTRSRALDALRTAGKTDIQRINEDLGREVCRQSGAQALIVGTAQKLGDALLLDVKVVDPSKSEYLFAAKEQAHGKAEVPAALDRLSVKLRDGLREASADISASQVRLAQATTGNLTAYRHYFEGEHHLARLELDAALAEYQQASAADPTFILTGYRIAFVLKWLGRPGALQAVEPAYRAREALPEKERALVEGLYLKLTHHPEEAAAAYRGLLKKFPQEKEAQFAVGDLAFHTLRLDEAERELERTLELDAQYPRALQHMVWTMSMLDRTPQALEYAKRYFKGEPSDEARLLLADAYGAAGDFDEAKRTLEPALETPARPDALLDLAQVAVAQRQYDQAAQQLAAAAATSTDGGTLGTSGVTSAEVLSWSELYAGKTDAAIERVEAAVPGRPAELKIEQALYVLLAKGDEARARALIDEVWGQRSTLGLRAGYHLLDALWRLGELDRSAEWLQAQQLEGFPNSRGLQRGHEARAAGRWDDCARLMETSVWQSLAGVRPIHADELADCQERAGRHAAAVETARHALKTFPGVHETRYGLRPLIYPRLAARLGGDK